MADEPLVMPQDEYEMVCWVFEMTGGPAFPENAVFACRIAARRNFAGCGDVFTRLAEAIDGARSAAESTERKLAAITDYCEAGGRMNYGLVKADGILAIIGGEQEVNEVNRTEAS